MIKNRELKIAAGLFAFGVMYSGASFAQFASTPQADTTFSASPVQRTPKVSTFGVPIGQRTEEALNEPIAVQRVRCGQEDACFRGNEPEEELAQDVLVESRPVDPVSVDDGLYASLSLGYTHHDNVERTSTDPQDDGGLGIGLGLLYRNRVDRLSYQAAVHTSAVSYDHNDNNDFNDYLLSGGLLYELTEVVDLGLHAGYSSGDEERNASGSRIVPENAETDEVRTRIIGGQITIGRPQSRIQFVLAGSYSEEDYTIRDPNEIAANAVDLRNRDYDHLSAAVFYNTQGPIRYFLEADVTDINYENTSIRNLDSRETGVFVGALWSISAITSAELKVGQIDKNFDDPAYQDDDDLAYLGTIRWQPTFRTAFTFYGSQRPEESPELFSTYYESRVLGVNVVYQLLPQKLDLLGYYNDIDDNFSSGRDDTTEDYGIGFIYHARPWLGLGFRYGHSQRKSNLPEANYEDDFYNIFLQMNAGNSIKLF